MKRLNLLVIALFYLPLTATGGVYEKYARMSNSLQVQLKTQAQATLNLYFENGLSCSGIFIDSEGRALTNLHCIEGCLMKKGVTSEDLAYSEPVFIDPQNSDNKQFLKKMRPDLSKGVSCSVRFGIGGKKEATVSAKILYIFGPGFLYPRVLVPNLTEKFPLVSQALKTEGFEASGDLALIQMPMPAGASCTKIDYTDFSKIESLEVSNLAYPIVLRKTSDANQPIALIGDGETLLYSTGQSSASIPFLKTIFGKQAENELRSILPQGTFLSSTDAEVGTSGSPMFSKSGKLIGIARATYNYNQTEYSAWLTHGISIEFHTAKIKELVPLNENCAY